MSLVCHRCVIGTVLLYLSPCFYPGDFVNCWERPDITPEAEIPAGVMSHTSQNLIKKNMGTETKGPSPSFPAGVISQTSPNKEKHGDGNKRTVPMFSLIFAAGESARPLPAQSGVWWRGTSPYRGGVGQARYQDRYPRRHPAGSRRQIPGLLRGPV